MKCPYLSEASKKVCVKMLEAEMNGEVSEFDLKHFCDGNPIYCYYFRFPVLQQATEVSTDEHKETSPFTTPETPKKGWSIIKDLLFKPEKEQ